MKRKYGIGQHVCGVYLIENLINHKKYVGSSTEISNRFSEHLGRETRLYPEREFYKDVLEYGRDNFLCSVLEVCDKEDLIAREQFWYDKLHPEYNIFRPIEHTAQSEGFKEYMKKKGSYEKTGAALKKLYASDDWKDFFYENSRWKFRAVEMYDDSGFSMEFECIKECVRYIESITDFKGKNKSSKIIEVCEGKRPTAFGFKYRYIDSKCNDYPKGSKDAIDTHSEAGSSQE